jgi:hypothetical protein
VGWIHQLADLHVRKEVVVKVFVASHDVGCDAEMNKDLTTTFATELSTCFERGFKEHASETSAELSAFTASLTCLLFKR